MPLGVSPLESNQPYQPMPPDIMDRCGFAPHMSRLPKPDYGYADFTVFYRTCNLVLLRDSTDNKIVLKRLPIPPLSTARLMSARAVQG